MERVSGMLALGSVEEIRARSCSSQLLGHNTDQQLLGDGRVDRRKNARHWVLLPFSRSLKSPKGSDSPCRAPAAGELAFALAAGELKLYKGLLSLNTK